MSMEIICIRQGTHSLAVTSYKSSVLSYFPICKMVILILTCFIVSKCLHCILKP